MTTKNRSPRTFSLRFVSDIVMACSLLCASIAGCGSPAASSGTSAGSAAGDVVGTGGATLGAGDKVAGSGGSGTPGDGGNVGSNSGGVATGGESVGTGGEGGGENVVFPKPEKPQWTVDTLAKLRDAIALSDQNIVMKEGDYKLTELPSEERNLLFTGSNNTVNLVGVYIEVPVGSTARESYLTMTGSGNTVIGGVFEDTYSTGLVDVTDYYSYNQDQAELAYGLRGAAVFSVLGNANLIDGIKLTVRGSFPYGYGSIYGIGAENTFGLNKRCGIVIKGQDNILDHVEIQQRAFCHGIYMQSPADNTTIRNSWVEGVMRLGDELYQETEANSLPSQSGFKLPHEGDGTQDVPKDVMLPLSEDGIRVYTDGGSVTVDNCTVKKMRGGIRLYLASAASVSNSTAIDCGATNYNLPSGGTVSNSSGNFAYAPLNDNRLARSNQNLDLTIMPSPHATGPHNIADILGNNQTIVFHRTPGPLDSAQTRVIVVSGNNSTIRNETEYRIIVTGSGNDITSAGEVTNNGSNNDLTVIDLEL